MRRIVRSATSSHQPSAPGRARLRALLRQLNRLRWLEKARIVASHGHLARRHLRYVLFDYPFEGFCYPVANLDELARRLSCAFSREPATVRAIISELEHDDVLQTALATRLRLPGDRRPVEFGYRLPWYVVARLGRPRLIIETGIQSGLGSALLLRALQRNTEEGAPGELVSVDTAPCAGWLVNGSALTLWRRLVGPSDPTLKQALAGERVSMLVHDSPHTKEVQSAEFGFAMENADDQLILLDASGSEGTVLSALCQRVGVAYHYFHEQPVSGFYQGVGTGLAILPGSVARSAPAAGGPSPD